MSSFFGEFIRGLIELLFAAHAAKKKCLAAVFALCDGIAGLYVHAANGILCHFNSPFSK
jgi:hypothetical protein